MASADPPPTVEFPAAGFLPSCAYCGAALAEGTVTCPQCGRPGTPRLATRTSVRLGPDDDRTNPLPAADARPDSQRAKSDIPSRFKVLRELGRGGMGLVFECEDTALGRRVAVKVLSDRYGLDAKAVRRFLREAHLQALLNHPNIARVLNAGLSEHGRPFLVMECIAGHDLREELRGHPQGLAPARALGLMRQACAGLQEAHAAGIVHRDIKPSNLMLARDPQGREVLKILDLGLAKFLPGAATDFRTLTLECVTLAGTPAYMSPEQALGAEVDTASDLYSLGIVFFQLLTGALPFASDTLPGWLHQHLYAEPLPPSQLSPELKRIPGLDALVLQTLAKNPGQRPASVGELAERLARLERSARALRDVETVVSLPAPKEAGGRDGLRETAQRPVAETPVQPAPATEEQARQRAYADPQRKAEEAENAGHLLKALESWRQALPFAPEPRATQQRIGQLLKALDEEKVFTRVREQAARGEWQAAELALSGCGADAAAEARVEHLRATFPALLLRAWTQRLLSMAERQPPPPNRPQLLRDLAVVHARRGEFDRTLEYLAQAYEGAEQRAFGAAHAFLAAAQEGCRDGLRPRLERTLAAAGHVKAPFAAGLACLETGRALAAYGDSEAAAQALQKAAAAFASSPEDQLQPLPAPAKVSLRSFFQARETTGSRRLQGRPLRLAGLAAVAQAQAHAALANDALATLALVDDPWLLAQSQAETVRAFAQAGRFPEAEQLTAQMTYRLPQATAQRFIALARLYQGNLEAAQALCAKVGAPHEQALVKAYVAAALWLRGARREATAWAQSALLLAAQAPDLSHHLAVVLDCVPPLAPLHEADGSPSLAQPFLDAALATAESFGRHVDRLFGLLRLVHLHLTESRGQGRPGDPVPASDVPLRKAADLLRFIQTPAERELALEAVAFAAAFNGLHDLAAELLRSARNDHETACVLLGLAEGMV